MLTEAKQRVLLGEYPLRLVASFTDSERMLAQAPQSQERDAAWRRQFTQVHAHREAMLVLQGEVTQGLNGVVYHGGPGTLFLYDVGERHDGGFPPTAPDSDQMWMFFAPGFITCQGVEVRGGRYGRDFRHSCKSPELIKRLNNTWDAAAKGAVRLDLALAQLRALFSVLFTDVVAAVERPPGGSSVQKEAILEIKQFLQHTAGRGVDVTTLARMAGFSRSHFLRLFRQHVGMTVYEVINEVRRQRYQELLAEGVSMKVIADELGLQSSSALAHWRRKHIDAKKTSATE
ncbi:MAG: AraC family transcriptional regulator [Lentisphaerae bacterium]|jgi:AraC-like DNA-binding protein|nr:AraC family transcriptional regulator [Lentisphaerota bacterium]